MKKIIHVITGLNTGGAEMMLYKLLADLDRQSYQHAVISLGTKGTIGSEIESLGISLYCLNLQKMRHILSSPAQLSKIFKREKPDIIQGWMYHGNFIGLMIKILIDKKAALLWNIRYSLYDIAREKLNTRLIIRICGMFSRLPEVIIYNSKIATTQHEKIGYSLSRHCVIPNGFDCQIFRPSNESRANIRRELNIANDDIVVGHVARFHPMKGHDVFFDAVAMLYDRYPNVHYVLSGRGVSRLSDAFRHLLMRFSSPERIHLLEERRDIPALTASFDLAVSSSSWGEGFSNTVGEAMACGVPCVVTDVGDSAWIVGDGGTVVPPSQPKALADALEKSILCGSDRRKAIGARGRLRIENHFSIQEISRQYNALYDSVTSG